MRAACLLGLVLLLPTAAADHGAVTYAGTIHLSDTGLLIARLAPCDPASPLNGLDGHWFAIDGFAGHPFALAPEFPLDGFVEFFDAACSFVGGWNERGPGGIEDGVVPAGSANVLVSGYVGSPAGRGPFVLELG